MASAELGSRWRLSSVATWVHTRLKGDARDPASAVLGFASIVGPGLVDGGFFPRSWGAITLVALWMVGMALLLSPATPGRVEIITVGGLVALFCWSALSLLWSTSAPLTVLELERTSAYVAVLIAILLVARRSSTQWLLGGTCAGIVVVCGVGLAKRLLQSAFGAPDPRTYDASALFEPVGYSNALGSLAAVGILICVGFATQPQPVARALASGGGVLLFTALTLSLSRGAWFALFVGAIAALAVGSRRRELLRAIGLVALPGAIAVVLASRAESLVVADAPRADVLREGHRLAVAIFLLAVVGGTASAFVHRLVGWEPGKQLPWRRTGLLIGLGALVALTLALVRIGGPVRLADETAERLQDPPARAQPSPFGRLLTLSSGRREHYWAVAWKDFEQHPVMGSGSGTYERYWLEHRPVRTAVRDAHSLYLETLAEIGIVGLALLSIFLLAPVVAALSVRADPLVSGTLGAYSVAFVHAGLDWLWEMPVVTLAGICCGASLLVRTRPEVRRPLPGALRTTTAALATVLGALALVGLVGNAATEAAEEAAAVGDLDSAERDARRAARWAPWAAEPWRILAQSHIQQGDVSAARKALDRALERDEGDWRLWYERGLLSTGMERQRAFAEARRLNPRGLETPRLPP